MKRSIRIRAADPAGNITIFVLDRVDRSEYAKIAQALLALPELRGEQVGFVTGPSSMEMCGLEFCGNASRSFALMVAEEQMKSAAGGTQVQGPCKIVVDVSGSDEPLEVEVRPETAYTKIRMPLHRQILTLPDLPGKLIDFGGIAHLVTEGIPASDEFFETAKKRIEDALDPPALGVMFCDGTKMTPIVYVRDVDTVYYEGSCGSGTTAYGIAHATGNPNGTYSFPVEQPAGSLITTVEVRDGEVTAVWIEGPVGLSDPVTVTLELPDLPETERPERFPGGFPDLEEFREMVSAELDELPEFFFKDLSGGVLVEDVVAYSQYAKQKDLYTLGNYSVSPLGRQIRIFYGSFRNSFNGYGRTALQARIREVVRHEFRHHLEFLGGVHGKDSLEEEDRRKIREYLRQK
ncbi:MAG: hypothetical protein IJH75_05210 [Mogibacterium sp.]|nr:hypothetical protein [Mogibacterium sp.]